MRVIEEVFESLSSWSSAPVLIEPKRLQAPLIVHADELKDRVSLLTRSLRSWGIQARSPVLLFLENSIDFAVVYLALLNTGAVPVPLKLEYRKMELDEIVTNAEAQAVICENYHFPIIEPYCRDISVILRENGRIDLLRRGDPLEHRCMVDSEIVSINYTYRGYGYPIGALLPQGQYLHGARVVQDELEGRPGETMMALLPLSHIFPIVCGLFLCLLYRMTFLICNTLHPRWIFNYIERYRVNYVTAVPEIYELLWKCKNLASDLSSLQLLFSGGSRLSEDLYRRVYDSFGVYLAHGYGLTEFTPISRNSGKHNRPGTVGPICSGVEVKIAGCDANQNGEILFRTRDMVRGYHNRVNESRKVLVDGWFHTGDLGRIDRGHLIFAGEKKNTCKVNGMMVDLEELRRAILSVKGVKEATVFLRRGSISTNIRCIKEKQKSEFYIQLKRILAEILARYKIPKDITPY